MHNLLRRHPACLVLIDRQAPSGPAADATEPSTLGKDVFLMEDPDPASSRAIESSLWEVKTLGNHYYYQVQAGPKALLLSVLLPGSMHGAGISWGGRRHMLGVILCIALLVSCWNGTRQFNANNSALHSIVECLRASHSRPGQDSLS